MNYNLNNLEIGERILSIEEGMFMSREKFSDEIVEYTYNIINDIHCLDKKINSE